MCEESQTAAAKDANRLEIAHVVRRQVEELGHSSILRATFWGSADVADECGARAGRRCSNDERAVHAGECLDQT